MRTAPALTPRESLTLPWTITSSSCGNTSVKLNFRLLLLNFTVVAHRCLVTMLMTTGLPLPALTPSRSRTLTDIGANPNPHPNPNPKANPNPNPNLNHNPNPTAYPKTSANPNHDQVP